MPRTRMDELFALAEEQNGLFTSTAARSLGIQDSVLVRLRQRGRLERMSRGVYRITHYPTERFAQYREAVLWVQASNGPERIALSHETALLLHGISHVNPSQVSLTVPASARMRRVNPAWIEIHRADLATWDIQLHEAMPVTTVERSIADVLTITHRTDFARQAITEAVRKGLLNSAQASSLRKQINLIAHGASLSTKTRTVREKPPSIDGPLTSRSRN